MINHYIINIPASYKVNQKQIIIKLKSQII